MLNFLLLGSLRNGRLEVVGARKNGAREGETRVSRANPFFFPAHITSKRLLRRLASWCCANYC